MHNFVYHNPVKVIFGKGVIAQTGNEAKTFGRKVLFVYGRKSVISNGTYKEICRSLQECDLTIVEHGGVDANPLLSHVNKGIQIFKESNCDLIIGAGGGSVIDTAKAISAGISVNHDIWKFFTGKKSVKEVIPVIAIPTIAGSGSEMNSGMVLTHDVQKLKLGFGHRKLYPKVCIADPCTTFSVSSEQSAYGAVDNLVHCLEAYFTASQPHPPFQFRLIENICKTLIENCPVVISEPQSFAARANMLWCASMALGGLTVAGIGRIDFPIHLIEHGISAHFDIPHGAGLAAILAGWIDFNRAQLKHQLCDFASHVLAISQPGDPSDHTIKFLLDFLNSINAPNCLSDIGIMPKDYPAIIDHCLYQAKIWRYKNYDEKQIKNILLNCQNPL